jgi:hypothetical protein
MRYFFDVREASGVCLDDVGISLQNVAAADREALHGLADLIRDRIAQEKLGEVIMEVRDERGDLVVRASVAIRHEIIAGSGS